MRSHPAKNIPFYFSCISRVSSHFIILYVAFRYKFSSNEIIQFSQKKLFDEIKFNYGRCDSMQNQGIECIKKKFV